MLKFIGQVLLFPFQLAVKVIELIGRTAAVIVGLTGFGLGALSCLFPPFVVIGAPAMLICGIIVIKAL
ncbi:hypothetical protein JXA32_13815 [Candidatus Sumerlaeota bacterium]|nr:hypothetical protein [Candidatus Sumerlaeota bacterium]